MPTRSSAQDFAGETAELVDTLLGFRLPITEVIGSGGGEAPSTQRLRRTLHGIGWPKHVFEVRLNVDGVTREAISHEIDHVRRAERGVLALEIEWNNKDPFFDRDLENFQRLHALSAISVGVIVTRGDDLHAGMTGLVEAFLTRLGVASPDDLRPYGMKRRTDRQTATLGRAVAVGMPFARAFAGAFVKDKFGEATTHWRELETRVARGVGNPCPLLLIGLPLAVIDTEGGAASATYSAASDFGRVGVGRPVGRVAVVGLVAPDRPAGAGAAAEELEVRAPASTIR